MGGQSAFLLNVFHLAAQGGLFHDSQIAYRCAMELWIAITVFAAFLQNLRSSVQKHLTSVMGTTGATFVRFGFGVPFAFAYWCFLVWGTGKEFPILPHSFFAWLVIGAIAQIAATFLLIHLFSLRNFTVGNAYARTEPIQTAIFAFLIFGVQFGSGAIAAIIIAAIGVILISLSGSDTSIKSLIFALRSRAALVGLSAGALFGLTAIGFQAAARSVGAASFVVQAATTLLLGIILQSLLMIVYIFFKERDEIVLVAKAWKPALLVGFVGATATFGWFIAFTLQQAALVKVVAQVEMLFSFGTSVFVFREKISRAETIGCILIVASILCLFLSV